LTNKFARRFVIGLGVIIAVVKRYLQDATSDVHLPSLTERLIRETTMRKTILTFFGATLIAATTAQMAAASEHHARQTFRMPVPASQQFQNANNSTVWSGQAGGYSSAGPGGYNTGR
jgi:hypothetical protein